jgi:hypothetical protein
VDGLSLSLLDCADANVLFVWFEPRCCSSDRLLDVPLAGLLSRENGFVKLKTGLAGLSGRVSGIFGFSCGFMVICQS